MLLHKHIDNELREAHAANIASGESVAALVNPQWPFAPLITRPHPTWDGNWQWLWQRSSGKQLSVILHQAMGNVFFNTFERWSFGDDQQPIIGTFAETYDAVVRFMSGGDLL